MFFVFVFTFFFITGVLVFYVNVFLCEGIVSLGTGLEIFVSCHVGTGN